MEEIRNTESVTVLAANDQSPLVRKAVRRFRESCRGNIYTRWLPPKRLLSKEFRQSKLPLSWTTQLPEGGLISITPDAIIGFDVSGSSRRVLLLFVDDGSSPVTEGDGDSLLLRTTALAFARDKPSLTEPMGVSRFRSGKVIILWLMRDLERLEQLKRGCFQQKCFRICLIDQDTFNKAPNIFSIRWQMPDQPPHTLI